ncbi:MULTISPECIES: hypothetical protein [unclassified Nonomuraea]|uniref:hypothetical protein n=1 Tax=unclassified Nonomuraea TaxID=2593643 RepID=UPI0033DFC2A7
MDNYRGGLALYLEGAAASTAASFFAVNPILKWIAKYCATSIGTILSDPGAIKDEAYKAGDMSKEVEEAVAALEKAFSSITKEEWEKMGREAAEEAKEKFGTEAKDVKEVFEGLKGVMDSLANLSLAGAIVSGLAGTTIISLVLLSNTTKLLGPLGAGTDIATVAAGNRLMDFVRAIVAKKGAAYTTAAALTGGISSVLMMRASSAASKAAQPTGTKAPDFQQVYLPDLPKTDAKGLPLK